MGADTKEVRKLLDYQLSDFLELRLGDEERKFVSKLKREMVTIFASQGPNLYEFPAIGTRNSCLILSNGFSRKLKQLFLMNPDGSLRKISL